MGGTAGLPEAATAHNASQLSYGGCSPRIDKHVIYGSMIADLSAHVALFCESHCCATGELNIPQQPQNARIHGLSIEFGFPVPSSEETA